jgi:hypothetical protein
MVNTKLEAKIINQILTIVANRKVENSEIGYKLRQKAAIRYLDNIEKQINKAIDDASKTGTLKGGEAEETLADFKILRTIAEILIGYGYTNSQGDTKQFLVLPGLILSAKVDVQTLQNVKQRLIVSRLISDTCRTEKYDSMIVEKCGIVSEMLKKKTLNIRMHENDTEVDFYIL